MRIRLTLHIYLLILIYQSSFATGAIAQTLPTLPSVGDISCGTSSGTTITVAAGGNFQTALNNAKPGDTIVLAAGATYTGNFIVPAKTGTGCITIRSSAIDSALPGPGVRTSPAYASKMAKLVASGGAAITFASGSHHYRLMHLEITASAYVDTLVMTAEVAYWNGLPYPHHLELDRVYIHGHSTLGTKRGVAMHANGYTVQNSYISDIKAAGADSQAIGSWGGGTGFRILNNYLEGAGENVMFGGSSAWMEEVNGGDPSDIEIRDNTFFKPLTWRKEDPTYTGLEWTVKNLLEFKHAVRVLVEHNTFENCWPHAQAGFAILVTPKNDLNNQSWIKTRDITIRNNTIKNTTRGMQIQGFGWPYEVQQTDRVLIQNNLFDGLGAYETGGDGYNDHWFQITSSPLNLIIRHNTTSALAQGFLIGVEGGPAVGFTFQDNIASFGTLGISSTDGHGSGTTALNYHFPSSIFAGNVIYNTPSGWMSSYPSSNAYPSDQVSVGFVDTASGNYRLTSASRYSKTGTDGTDPGVDVDKLPSFQSMRPITDTTPPAAPLNLRVL